jgi:hypothetical protein
LSKNLEAIDEGAEHMSSVKLSESEEEKKEPEISTVKGDNSSGSPKSSVISNSSKFNIRRLMKTNSTVANEMKELTHIANISSKYNNKSQIVGKSVSKKAASRQPSFGRSQTSNIS